MLRVEAGQHSPGAEIRKPAEMLAQLDRGPHLWLLSLDRDLDAAWIADHEPLLSKDERARYRRYVRAEDRELFLAAHVFVRKTLSHYASIEPAAWRFITADGGRPEIAHGEAPKGLRFNLAHTASMVALLVHDDADAGVDIEHLGNVADPISMVPTVFTEAEHQALTALDQEHQEVAFYRLWTLKEAFMKATGKGMAMPLQAFSFTDTAGSQIRVTCGPEIEPEPEAWRFTVHRPSPRFVVATAYRGGAAGRLPVVRNMTI